MTKSRKDRILDAAEKLFSSLGFEAVTMRKIASQAGVDLALASYHFGSKRGLFDAVLLRRAEVMNDQRLMALEACCSVDDSAASKPDGAADVEAIIDAYLRPILVDIAGQGDRQGWRCYYALVAQVNNSPEWGGQLMTKYFDPLAQAFIDALRDALPDASEEDLYWCYHILSGALTLTFAQTGRIDNLSQGRCRSDDLAAAYRRMVPFITAGIKAVCAPS